MFTAVAVGQHIAHIIHASTQAFFIACTSALHLFLLTQEKSSHQQKSNPEKPKPWWFGAQKLPFSGAPPPYLLLGTMSGAGGILAGHLSTSRRHLISDQQLSHVPQVGQNCQGLGFGHLCRGYLQGERGLRPRGTAPGTQLSCWLRSLRLQRGAKYLHMPHKALLTGTAWPYQHTAPSLTMSSNKPRICPHASFRHLLCRDFPSVWGLKYLVVFLQTFCLSIIKEWESSSKFPVPTMMTPTTQPNLVAKTGASTIDEQHFETTGCRAVPPTWHGPQMQSTPVR